MSSVTVKPTQHGKKVLINDPSPTKSAHQVQEWLLWRIHREILRRAQEDKAKKRLAKQKGGEKGQNYLAKGGRMVTDKFWREGELSARSHRSDRKKRRGWIGFRREGTRGNVAE